MELFIVLVLMKMVNLVLEIKINKIHHKKLFILKIFQFQKFIVDLVIPLQYQVFINYLIELLLLLLNRIK